MGSIGNNAACRICKGVHYYIDKYNNGFFYVEKEVFK